MNFPNVVTTGCIPTTPPPLDPRCSDPAFAKAYPDICSVGGSGSEPVLVLKPSTALTCSVGPIQFQTFIDQGGVETQVTSGVVYSSSDITIAAIGAASGNAMGVSAGTATITASYNGMTATAELTVIGTGSSCCDNQSVATMLVVDVSKSMSLAFGNGFATKEDYAAKLASDYASQTNYTKDTIGLITFDSTPNVVVPLPSSASQAEIAAITGPLSTLTNTPNLTGIGLALQAAANALAASSAAIKVIVLFSDGEDKDDIAADAPLPIAEAFQATGGIIVCVGIRAHDAGFNLLNGLATGGFFLNAFPSNADATENLLEGLKGYFCAGNCTPKGDDYESVGALNYTNFLHWNVTSGCVDLKGNGFLDLQPGNGMYVDLAGSFPDTPPLGTMTTKQTFNFVPGVTYRIAVLLAGNQQNPNPNYSVLLQIGDNGAVFKTVIAIPDYTQGFQTYAFTFTVNTAMSGAISLTQQITNESNPAFLYIGNYFKSCELDDMTNSAQLFFNDFTGENLHYIPPSCGPSQTLPGYYGYACYGYGCLDAPPPAQMQDPNPLADIEAGYVPPTQYSSTKSYTATCPSCQTQSDGSTTCSTQLGSSTVVPSMTGYTTPSGTVTTTSDVAGSEAWRAFVAAPPVTAAPVPSWKIDPTLAPSSQSVTYQFPSAQTILAFSIQSDNSNGLGTMTAILLQGSNDGATWTTVAQSQQIFYNETRTRMNVTNPGAYTYYRLTLSFAVNPIGIAFIEYFAAAANNNGITKTATATSFISQADADAKALAAAQQAAQQALAYAGCAVYYSATEAATVQCPCGQQGNPNSVTASASATSYLSLADAQAQATAAAQAAAAAQLDCTFSNNQQAITINDYSGSGQCAPASPFPSVTYYAGPVASISKVTVTLKGFSHTYPSDVAILLVGPDGTAVPLMFNEGGNQIVAAPGVNLTFDDSAGGTLPTPIVAGTYKPVQSNPGDQWPPCAPQGTLHIGLSNFNGKNPKGSWALYVADCKVLDVGSIANGWTLNIS